MNYLTSEQRTIAAQRERIEELEEELRQAKEASRPAFVFPIEWGLRPSGRKMLAALYIAPGGFLTHEKLFDHIVCRSDGDNSLNILRTQMHHLRSDLKPFGVEIQHRWGIGYELPAESKAIIRAALEQRAAA